MKQSIILAAAVALLAAVAAHAGSRWLPDPRLTPGAINPTITQGDIHTTICVPGFTKTIRPPARYTSRLKRAQLNDPARGYVDKSMRDYEEDHRVPLEVGGNPIDPRNLWPEPLRGPWNAHLKDRLENRIHELVCARVITLEQGRAAFLGDWTVSAANWSPARTARRKSWPKTSK